MELHVRKAENDTITIIDLKGELDMYNCEEIKKKIQEITAYPQPRVIFNFRDLSYIDSSGVGVIITILKQSRKENGSVCFVHFSESVKKVLSLVNMLSLIKCFDSEEAAINHLVNF